jgi:surface polysaccharide O-acyltransferase-like enzyme
MKDSSLPYSRIQSLDNIRAIVIGFVVIFHSILAYTQTCPWWYVNDPPPIPYSFHFIVFMEPILMPILFLIAGMLAWPSYERKGTARFMIAKMKRLFFPFLLCTLLFSPILPFIRQSLRAKSSGGEALGFWPFWLNFLQSGSRIKSGSATFSTEIVVNQYWFLMLLFIFFAGFSLVVHKRRDRIVARADSKPAEPVSRARLLGTIAIFCLVLGAVYAWICLYIEGNVWVTLGDLWQIQPAKIHIYLGFFIAGIAIERRNLYPEILRSASPAVWLFSTLLIASVYLFTVIKTAGVPDASMPLIIASRFLRLFFIVTVSLWFLTFFHRRANKATLFWREISENSYNIYLIHMVPQVVIQMLFISWPAASLPKFVTVSLLSLLVSYLASRFLVRRSSVATILVLVLIFISLCVIFA